MVEVRIIDMKDVRGQKNYVVLADGYAINVRMRSTWFPRCMKVPEAMHLIRICTLARRFQEIHKKKQST